jgi:hypothetical protein
MYKAIPNCKSTVGNAFPTQITTNKLIDSHEYNYDISTPISSSLLKSSPFKSDLLGSNHVQSRESLHNNIIVEDEKEVNYSTSNLSTNRKSSRSKNKTEVNTDGGNAGQDRNKEKSFSKDLIMQMKEKIRRKQRNNADSSKILVLGNSQVQDSYKNTEYNDFGFSNHHNISTFNNSKQSKKVSSLGRSPHKKKTKVIKKVSSYFKCRFPLSRMLQSTRSTTGVCTAMSLPTPSVG